MYEMNGSAAVAAGLLAMIIGLPASAAPRTEALLEGGGTESTCIQPGGSSGAGPTAPAGSPAGEKRQAPEEDAPKSAAPT